MRLRMIGRSMNSRVDGEYVLYSDYEKLEAENARLKEANAHKQIIINTYYAKEPSALKAENERLNEDYNAEHMMKELADGKITLLEKVVKERNELIARLKEELEAETNNLASIIATHLDTIDDLEAENARLNNLVRRIDNRIHDDDLEHKISEVSRLLRYHREYLITKALEETE